MCILCLNEVRQTRIPPHFYQPHKVDRCLKQTVILECAEPDYSKIPVKKIMVYSRCASGSGLRSQLIFLTTKIRYSEKYFRLWRVLRSPSLISIYIRKYVFKQQFPIHEDLSLLRSVYLSCLCSSLSRISNILQNYVLHPPPTEKAQCHTRHITLQNINGFPSVSVSYTEVFQAYSMLHLQRL